jgi:hypothetical protein
MHTLIHSNYFFISTPAQNGWQWDFVVFFVQFVVCGAVCILGLWFNEAPVLRIYERLKQRRLSEKAVASYSTFVPNQTDRVRASTCPLRAWPSSDIFSLPTQFPEGNTENAEDRASFFSQLCVLFPPTVRHGHRRVDGRPLSLSLWWRCILSTAHSGGSTRSSCLDTSTL